MTHDATGATAYIVRMSDYIEVTGSGAAAGVPDVVVLDTRFTHDGRDVAAALEGCAQVVARAVAAATEHGITEKNRQSTGIGVNQRWDNQGQKIVGYTAYQTLRLVVRDRSTVGDLIARLAAAAGNSFGLDSVTLSVSDTSALQTQARDAAFADARGKAQEYAVLSGRELGPVTRVVESVDGPAPMPKMYGRRDAVAMEAGSMPVEAGESTVTAAVTVRFGLV